MLKRSLQRYNNQNIVGAIRRLLSEHQQQLSSSSSSATSKLFPLPFATTQRLISPVAAIGDSLLTQLASEGVVVDPVALREETLRDCQRSMPQLAQQVAHMGRGQSPQWSLQSEQGALLLALCSAIAERRAFAHRSRIAGTSTGSSINAALDKMVVYTSDQAPPYVEHVCRMVGLHRVRRLPTVFLVHEQNYPLTLEQVEFAMAEDIAHGLVPMIVLASIGAYGTAAVDPVEMIGRLCQRCGVWMHVLSDFTGAAASLCGDYSSFLTGLEFASSIGLELHRALGLGSGGYQPSQSVLLIQKQQEKEFIAGGNGSDDLPLASYDLSSSLRLLAALQLEEDVPRRVRQLVELHEHLAHSIRGTPALECHVRALGDALFRLPLISDEDNLARLEELKAIPPPTATAGLRQSISAVTLQTVHQRVFLRLQLHDPSSPTPEELSELAKCFGGGGR